MKFSERQRLFTVVDILSLSRILLAVLFVLTILKCYVFASLLIFTIGALSDALDGYLSRHYEKGKYGFFIDPLSDRIFIGLSLIGLYLSPLEKTISSITLILIVGQDLLLSPVGFYTFVVSVKKGIKIKASSLGKVTTLFQYLLVIFVISINLLKLNIPLKPFELIVILSSIASGVHHLYIWRLVLRRGVYQEP